MLDENLLYAQGSFHVRDFSIVAVLTVNQTFIHASFAKLPYISFRSFSPIPESVMFQSIVDFPSPLQLLVADLHKPTGQLPGPSPYSTVHIQAVHLSCNRISVPH
jgi:hypothetical protein